MAEIAEQVSAVFHSKFLSKFSCFGQGQKTNYPVAQFDVAQCLRGFYQLDCKLSKFFSLSQFRLKSFQNVDD